MLAAVAAALAGTRTARAEIVLAELPSSAQEDRFDPFVDRAGNTQGQSTIRTSSGATLRVYRTNDAVTQVTFARGQRSFALLRGGELAVVDYVFDKVSRNHFKFYAFPGPGPTRLAVRPDGRVEITFPNGDRMTRAGPDLALVACESDFAERDGHRTYQDGTRSLPRITHRGPRPFLLTVWYEYPPSDGAFGLYVDGERVGELATPSLYEARDGDVVRRFADLTATLREVLAGRDDAGVERFLSALRD